VPDLRMRGALAALDEAGIPPGPSHVQSAGFTVMGGYRAMTRILEHPDPPTAVFAFSDEMAIGAMRAAHEHGMAVPGDLSVAGFDDIPEAALSTPKLTTVRQPHHRKGAEAVRLLLAGGPAQSVLLPTELVIRASTAPVSRKESSP